MLAEPSVKTLRYLLEYLRSPLPEFMRYCVLSGETQRRALPGY